MLLDPRFISSLRSEGKMADKSDFATRRAASREKHGPELREIFKQVDKDNSGYASIDEMWYVFQRLTLIGISWKTHPEFFPKFHFSNYGLINCFSAFMANHGKVKLNKRSLGDFQASMVCKR